MDKQKIEKPEEEKVKEVKAEQPKPIPQAKPLPLQQGFNEPEEVRLVRLAHEAFLKKQQEKAK